MCKAHSDPISPSLKWKEYQEKRLDCCYHVPGPTAVIQAWGPLPDFSRAVLRGVGCHHWGPPLIWARVLGPSNWSLLLTPVPREQDHSSLRLKGSNFKPWVLGRQNRKVRSWLPPRCMPFKKMTLSAEGRRDEMISPYSFLSPSFANSSECLSARGAQCRSSDPGQFPLHPESQSCLISAIPSEVIGSKQITSLQSGDLLGLLISQMAFICLGFLFVCFIICSDQNPKWYVHLAIACCRSKSPVLYLFPLHLLLLSSLLFLSLPTSLSLQFIYRRKHLCIYRAAHIWSWLTASSRCHLSCSSVPCSSCKLFRSRDLIKFRFEFRATLLPGCHVFLHQEVTVFLCCEQP